MYFKLAFGPTAGVFAATLMSTILSAPLPVHAAGAPPSPSAADRRLGEWLDGAERGDLAPLQAALRVSKDPAAKALMRARLAAGRMDVAAVHQALNDPALVHLNDPVRQAMAWTIAVDADLAAGDYAAAAEAARHYLSLPPGSDPLHEARGMQETLSVAVPLAAAPAQAVLDSQPARIATVRDVGGLVRAPARINGVTQEAVLDTGANLSAVSASTARELKLRILGDSSIGSATRDVLGVRIAIADRVEIAGITLANVAFLVLDDDQLKLPVPGGFQIHAILGFPVFRALRCASFGADGGFTPCNSGQLPGEQLHNFRLGGNNLFVDASINDITVPLHLDTGASATNLSAAFAKVHPSVLEGLVRKTSKDASAGGEIEQQVGVLPSPILTLSGRSTKLPDLDIVVSGDVRAQRAEYGTLGQDALRAFDGYSIDFGTMSFVVGAPLKEASPAGG